LEIENLFRNSHNFRKFIVIFAKRKTLDLFEEGIQKSGAAAGAK
jgi:hypothetical protein